MMAGRKNRLFTKKQVERYAEVLMWGLKTARKKKFKPNDIILIRYDQDALELAEALYNVILKWDMHPIQRMGLTPAMELDFYTLGNPRQLVFQPPGEEELIRHINGYVVLHAPASITHLSRADPKKIVKATVARKYLRDIMNEREEAGDFSWTLCAWPTAGLADQAGLEMKDYARQIIRACYLNRTDPVGQWKEIFKNAQHIKRWLNRMEVHHYHVESDHTDLVITPGHRRRWIGISGHNIPSFELFVSPDWRGTSGVYTADQPSFRSGNLVKGIRLEFSKGRLIDVTADKGETFAVSQFAMDGGAGRVGEFSLTDKRFSKIDTFMANTLFDENYGGKSGNCHIALGASYADTFSGAPAELTPKLKKDLGFNDSALHWDLVNTEKKRVTAHMTGGKKRVIYENGMFKI
jgi:aminopeptidase